MNEIIYQYLLKSMDNSKQAIFLCKVYERSPLFANKQALTHFSDSMGKIDIYEMFESKGASSFLISTITEQLRNAQVATVYDVLAIDNSGDYLLCDIEMNFADPEQEVLLIILKIKNDDRMEKACSQVNQSRRPEAILRFDEKLSYLHGNELFHSIFVEVNPNIRLAKGDSLLDVLEEPQRSTVLSSIYKQLESSKSYFTILKLCSVTGENILYAMEFQRKSLDNTPDGFVQVYFVNIQKQVEILEERAQINQYFHVLHKMSQGMFQGRLFRFDIEQKTLYSYGDKEIPNIYENFPSKPWLSKHIPAEEQEAFCQYIQNLTTVTEGIFHFYTPKGSAEQHKFIFHSLSEADGTVKEMLGYAMNIHDLMETQKEIAEMNRFLHSFQNVSDSKLYRFDIKNRIFYRHGITGNLFGASEIVKNYPDYENVKRILHPEDLQKYLDFIEQVVQGKEGSLESRIITDSGEYVYYKMTFEALRKEDGTVDEMIGAARNIQYQKDTEHQLAMVKRHFHALQELSQDLIFHIDLEDKLLIRYGSKIGLFGMKEQQEPFPEAVVNSGAIYPEDLPLFLEIAQQMLQGQGGSAVLRMCEQEHLPFTSYDMTWFPVVNHLGNVTEVTGKLQEKLIAPVQGKSQSPQLSKQALLDVVSKVLDQSNDQEKHAVFLLDIDNFQEINQEFHPEFGDFVLEELGKRLHQNIRSQDLVGRLSGDEYMVFLRDIPSVDLLQGKGKMLLSCISGDFVKDSMRHQLRGSLGIALYPDHGTSYEALYHHADLALQSAKALGKNKVVVYNPEETTK